MSAYAVSTRGLAGRKVPQGVLATTMDELLFSGSEQGAWYDPSDMSTMFQDSAGTTPVTAVGQPVGLLLDKSKGLVLGPELVTNGTFDNGISGWIQSAGAAGAVSWDETSTSLAVRDTGGLDGAAYTVIPTVAGRSYEAVFTILSAGGQCQFWVGTGGGASALQYNITYGAIVTPTTFKVVFRASHTNGSITFLAAAHDGTVLVTNVSIRELPGNHATQATTTKRPVLQQDGNGKYYLAFDGVDDSMATAAIDFTGTDKMTVWAGVTALDMGRTSGSPHQLLYSNGDNFNGFGLRTPNSPGNITFTSSGSIDIVETAEGSLGTAPRSMVICGVGDQSAPLSQLRRDGVLRASSTAAQGASGGYGNRAMWIGSQAGSSRFFNGSLYSLIVRGAQSSLSQIEATELYMKKKVGIA